MKRVFKFIGMEWAGSILRTAVQAAAVVLAGAGLGWVDADVWKMAGLAAGAAVFAYIQVELRKL